MTRIDGLGSLATSRTTQGNAAQGIEDAAGRPEGSERAAGKLDNISVSDRGRIVAEASLAVRNTPDVRADRVAALKASIANGSYASDARAIAERLLRSGSFGG
ncbi:MAG: flagellar biosynthesis anti-sigma factor FlgM [Chloroflexi bacterium]|nr:flagellar biosynthesis anti-sigma factor FlgM [Chloroflexota bacterium]